MPDLNTLVLRAAAARNTRGADDHNATASLAKIIDAAQRELAYTDHIASGADAPHARTRKPAVSTGFMDLRNLRLVPAVNAVGDHCRTLGSTEEAAKSEPLDASVIERSRVAQAGATVIVAAERPAPSGAMGGAFYRDAGLFRLIEAAEFSDVPDADSEAIPEETGEVETSILPFHSAVIEWPDAPSVAFRTIASRRQQKDVGGDTLAQDLMQSILYGLAQAADRTLLAAIVAASPSTFTHGLAAARNLEFSELRALVGTNGTGAAADTAGTLRVNGVLADYTPTIEETVVGAFNRAAVAIHPQIVVHVERRNLQGDLVVTCFANLLPLVPDASAFWLAGA